jgi:hypothetical protein
MPRATLTSAGSTCCSPTIVRLPEVAQREHERADPTGALTRRRDSERDGDRDDQHGGHEGELHVLDDALNQCRAVQHTLLDAVEPL